MVPYDAGNEDDGNYGYDDDDECYDYNYDMNLTLMMDVIMMISSINHPLQFSTVYYSVNLLVLPFH